MSLIRLSVDCWNCIFLEWEIRTDSGTHEHNPKNALINLKSCKIQAVVTVKQIHCSTIYSYNSTRSKKFCLECYETVLNEYLIFHPEMEIHSLGRFEVLKTKTKSPPKCGGKNRSLFHDFFWYSNMKIQVLIPHGKLHPSETSLFFVGK